VDGSLHGRAACGWHGKSKKSAKEQSRVPLLRRLSIQRSVFNLNQARKLAVRLGLRATCQQRGAVFFSHCTDAFVDTDASMLESNPSCPHRDGSSVALDSKMTFDDKRPLFVIKELRPSDLAERRSLEVEASIVSASIHQAGRQRLVGMVNGAGLAMATMDIIKVRRRSPALSWTSAAALPPKFR